MIECFLLYEGEFSTDSNVFWMIIRMCYLTYFNNANLMTIEGKSMLINNVILQSRQ